MEFKNIYECNKEVRNNFKELYKKSFPREERRPLSLIKHLSKKNKIFPMAIFDDYKQVGLLVYASYEDLIWIDFLAIDPDIQSSGLGSKALQKLFSLNPDKIVFIEVETPENKDKSNLKNKRIEFYKRNGFSLSEVRAQAFRCDFLLLANKGRVSFREYENITEKIYGKIFLKLARYKELDYKEI